jgi:uncharacterized protein YxeA
MKKVMPYIVIALVLVALVAAYLFYRKKQIKNFEEMLTL